jgi:hypothetical protein
MNNPSSTPSARREENKRLKEAALIIMDFFEKDFAKLDESDQIFANCFFEILIDMKLSNSPHEGRRFRYCPIDTLPDTLNSMSRAMDLYLDIYRVLNCIRRLATNDDSE